MAQIMEFSVATGDYVNAVIFDLSSGAVELFNTTSGAFEAYSAGNIAKYGVAGTEGSPKTTYSITIPAALPASKPGHPYRVKAYVTNAAGLATGDLNTVAVMEKDLTWNGVLPVTSPVQGLASSDVRIEYYVRSGGSDSNNGLSAANALANLSTAIALARPFDTINIDQTIAKSQLSTQLTNSAVPCKIFIATNFS